MGCPTVKDGLTTEWNAPNCQYFKMYRQAALAIKNVSPANLRGRGLACASSALAEPD